MASLEILLKELDDMIRPAIVKTYYLKGPPIEGLHLPGDMKMLWIWTTGERCLGART
jgi:hypothetical protein